MSTYSPFDKELANLEPGDLIALREVTEGWYVEYKSEISKAIDIAKSISAFANTYGGWLFYGVKEKSKEEAIAGAFPGIARADVDMSLQRMRQAVSEHVNPSAHFDTKVLWGPNNSIELAEDRAVICVHVPWSSAAPHVHRNGRIYRRVADSSEPRPESDRFVLDQLWRRSDNLRKWYEKWVERDPELSENEKERPFVRILLVADLWGHQGAFADIEIEEFREIVGSQAGIRASVPFDTAYTSATGYVARQLKGNNPQNIGLTWRFGQDLVSDILIPLSYLEVEDLSLLEHHLAGYDGAARFANLLLSSGHNSPRIVDLNFLFSVLVGVAEIHQRLLAKAKWTQGYFVKTRLINVWRTIPFVDIASILGGFEAHGVPMSLDANITAPGGTDPETFFHVSPHTQIDLEVARILLQALAMFAPIARSFGLPAWIDPDPDGKKPAYYDELQDAGTRAMDVQRRRNARSQEN